MSDKREADTESLKLNSLSSQIRIKKKLKIDWNMEKIATKFVNFGTHPLEDLKDTQAYILRTRLNNNGKLSRWEKDWITKKVNDNAYFKVAIPVFGWRFDFSDILHTYLVCQYGQWQEYKAVDKTSLKKILQGRIDKIVQL